jgi:hypothetical protein
MEKQITIAVAGSDETKDIAISPGATVSEVLEEAGLQGYQLLRKGGEPLDPSTDLFEDATDYEKLYATPQDVSVGDGGSASSSRFRNFIKGIIENVFTDKSYRHSHDWHKSLGIFRKKRVRIIAIRFNRIPVQPYRVRTKRKIKCKRKGSIVMDTKVGCPYWQENGWRRNGRRYTGHYRTEYVKCRGLVEENFYDDYSFYIFNPPEALRKSSHWECFTHKGKGKYAIHFSNKPRDVSSGIITVEQLIVKSFKGNGKGAKRCFLKEREIRECVLRHPRRI